jgi:hypothetical protein
VPPPCPRRTRRKRMTDRLVPVPLLERPNQSSVRLIIVAEAKDRAAQARDPSVKSAFENVAAGWIALADQVERIDSEKFPLRDQKIIALSANRHTTGTFWGYTPTIAALAPSGVGD